MGSPSQDPRSSLAALRESRRWTQHRLAHELARAADVLKLRVAERRSLVVQISRWENGHGAPGSDYRTLFCHVYAVSDAELGLADQSHGVDLEDRLGPISFRASWDQSFSQAAEEWNLDIQRREFLRGASYVAAASSLPALQWLVGVPEEPVRLEGSILVGSPHIESVREITRSFRALDNRFGGGQARESLLRFLVNEVKPLVLEGRYDRETGRELLSATAEALQLAGWMTYDAGHQGLGQRYMAQALRLALAADDGALGAEILAGLSHQASYLGDGATAVDLARAAGRAARERGMDALTAEAHVMEAHGHACLGDRAPCTAALSSAEAALDRADRSSDPGWIGYFDEAYLSAKFGHCFKELGDAAAGQRFARRSLEMDNSFVRGRAFNLALLATTHAQAGEVEAACAVGKDAATLVKDLQSVRARSYLRTLRKELEPFETSPAVADFDELARPLLAEAV